MLKQWNKKIIMSIAIATVFLGSTTITHLQNQNYISQKELKNTLPIVVDEISHNEKIDTNKNPISSFSFNEYCIFSFVHAYLKDNSGKDVQEYSINTRIVKNGIFDVVCSARFQKEAQLDDVHIELWYWHNGSAEKKENIFNSENRNYITNQNANNFSFSYEAKNDFSLIKFASKNEIEQSSFNFKITNIYSNPINNWGIEINWIDKKNVEIIPFCKENFKNDDFIAGKIQFLCGDSIIKESEKFNLFNKKNFVIEIQNKTGKNNKIFSAAHIWNLPTAIKNNYQYKFFDDEDKVIENWSLSIDGNISEENINLIYLLPSSQIINQKGKIVLVDCENNSIIASSKIETFSVNTQISIEKRNAIKFSIFSKNIQWDLLSKNNISYNVGYIEPPYFIKKIEDIEFKIFDFKKNEEINDLSVYLTSKKENGKIFFAIKNNSKEHTYTKRKIFVQATVKNLMEYNIESNSSAFSIPDGITCDNQDTRVYSVQNNFIEEKRTDTFFKDSFQIYSSPWKINNLLEKNFDITFSDEKNKKIEKDIKIDSYKIIAIDGLNIGYSITIKTDSYFDGKKIKLNVLDKKNNFVTSSSEIYISPLNNWKMDLFDCERELKINKALAIEIMDYSPSSDEITIDILNADKSKNYNWESETSISYDQTIYINLIPEKNKISLNDFVYLNIYLNDELIIETDLFGISSYEVSACLSDWHTETPEFLKEDIDGFCIGNSSVLGFWELNTTNLQIIDLKIKVLNENNIEMSNWISNIEKIDKKIRIRISMIRFDNTQFEKIKVAVFNGEKNICESKIIKIEKIRTLLTMTSSYIYNPDYKFSTKIEKTCLETDETIDQIDFLNLLACSKTNFGGISLKNFWKNFIFISSSEKINVVKNNECEDEIGFLGAQLKFHDMALDIKKTEIIESSVNYTEKKLFFESYFLINCSQLFNNIKIAESGVYTIKIKGEYTWLSQWQTIYQTSHKFIQEKNLKIYELKIV